MLAQMLISFYVGVYADFFYVGVYADFFLC